MWFTDCMIKLIQMYFNVLGPGQIDAYRISPHVHISLHKIKFRFDSKHIVEFIGIGWKGQRVCDAHSVIQHAPRVRQIFEAQQRWKSFK